MGEARLADNGLSTFRGIGEIAGNFVFVFPIWRENKIHMEGRAHDRDAARPRDSAVVALAPARGLSC